MGRDPAAAKWSCADLADILCAGFTAAAHDVELEQAVRGLDSMAELALHRVVQESFRSADLGVHPEQRYPRDRQRTRLRSHGERCDLVLTPEADIELLDPDAEQTLFASPRAVSLTEAFWLEVKLVVQFTEEGPNPRYAAELGGPIQRDVLKLSRDGDIRHAAMLIVIFCASEEVARHDLAVWEERARRKGAAISTPYFRFIPIGDRIGNTVCALALFPVSARPDPL